MLRRLRLIRQPMTLAWLRLPKVLLPNLGTSLEPSALRCGVRPSLQLRSVLSQSLGLLIGYIILQSCAWPPVPPAFSWPWLSPYFFLGPACHYLVCHNSQIERERAANSRKCCRCGDRGSSWSGSAEEEKEGERARKEGRERERNINAIIPKFRSN